MNMAISSNFDQLQSIKSNDYLCQVAGVSSLGSRVIQAYLTTPADFPHYSAGQYIEIVLADGSSRPFSIANIALGTLELHLEVNPDSSTTSAIISQLQQLAKIQVKSAKGDVALRPNAGAQVFLAAGTGFSQIKALIEQLLQNLKHDPASASQPFYLFWGADTAEQRYMKDLIKEWCCRYKNFHYFPLTWQQGESWESALAPQLHRLIDAQFYACGSPSRVYNALDFIEQQGLSNSQIQSDVFAYAPRPLRQNIS